MTFQTGLEMPSELVELLSQALSNKKGVIITYVSEGDPKPHDFLLFPKRIFERKGFDYVEGWSVHRPKRIKLYRGLHDTGKVRVFRVDRVLAITNREIRSHSLTSYAIGKVRRRGMVLGIWGLFLDLLLFMFFVGVVFSIIKLVFGH
jgi:hypothetical protein